MKVSYNPACTLHNATLAQDLSLCEKVGFDYTELRIDKLREYLKERTLDDLKAFFGKSRLRPYAVNAVYTYRELFGPNDDERSAKALTNDVLFACEVLKSVGADRLVVVPPMFAEGLNKTYDDPWPVALEDNVRIFRHLADLTAPYGVKIGIEIVGSARCSVRTMGQCNEIIKLVDRPNIGCTADAFNLYLYDGDDSFACIDEIALERLFIVHINGADMGAVSGLRQADRNYVDLGVMRVENYLERLHARGYDGPVSIEFFRQDQWLREPSQVIERAYTSTKKLLEKLGYAN